MKNYYYMTYDWVFSPGGIDDMDAVIGIITKGPNEKDDSTIYVPIKLKSHYDSVSFSALDGIWGIGRRRDHSRVGLDVEEFEHLLADVLFLAISKLCDESKNLPIVVQGPLFPKLRRLLLGVAIPQEKSIYFSTHEPEWIGRLIPNSVPKPELREMGGTKIRMSDMLPPITFDSPTRAWVLQAMESCLVHWEIVGSPPAKKDREEWIRLHELQVATVCSTLLDYKGIARLPTLLAEGLKRTDEWITRGEECMEILGKVLSKRATELELGVLQKYQSDQQRRENELLLQERSAISIDPLKFLKWYLENLNDPINVELVSLLRRTKIS